MAIKVITTEHIAATGVNFSSAQAGSENWRRSAEVAVQIANDPRFQDLEARFISASLDVSDTDIIAKTLVEKSEYVLQTFGSFPFFDSGVEQAANFAVATAIRENLDTL